MPAPKPASSAIPPWVRRVVLARFLVFSVLLHFIILIFAGTTVLYQAQSEPPDFIAGSESFMADSVEAAPPPEVMVTPDPVFTPAAPALSAPMAALTTTATSSFTMNALPQPSQGIADASAPALTAFSKRLGEGVGAGVMGKAGGMTGMIFGKKVEAKKLGVILDVSGSAHPHLAGAIQEIEKSFADSLLVLTPGCGMGEITGRSAHEIRKFSSIGKREFPPEPAKGSTASQLVKAFDVDEFEQLIRRPTMQERLFVSWFEGGQNTGGGSQTTQTLVSFEFLMRRGVDSIYWFADFRDPVNLKISRELLKDLKRRKIKVYLHNFAGGPIGPEVTLLAEGTGGTAETEKAN